VVEILPAFENPFGGILRDGHAVSIGHGEEDATPRVQERGAEGLPRRDGKRRAGLDASPGDLRCGRRLRSDLGRERVELELDEEVFQFPGVGLRALERRGLEGDRQVGRNPDERAREDRRLPVQAQALAHLARDLVGLREERLEAAVARNPLLRGHLADARDARDVVHAVPHERQHVGHLAGRHAEELLDSRLVQELFPPGVKDADAGLDELQHVLVGGHDHDVEAFRRGLGREGSENIVGLVAGQLQDRNPVGVEGAADVPDLGREVRGHGDAVRLVLAVRVLAKRPLRPVPGDREVIGSVLAQHLAEHVDEAVDGIGRLSRRGRKPLDRVVGAVDVGHRVDQVEFSRVGHERAIL
jgi:hypothetical protein